MYDSEVRVLLFTFVFYHNALLETPIQFSAFSAQEARYRQGVRAQRVKNIFKHSVYDSGFEAMSFTEKRELLSSRNT